MVVTRTKPKSKWLPFADPRRLLFCLSAGLLIAASFTVATGPKKGEFPTSQILPVAQISGRNWRYDLNFPVYNYSAIQKLIQCESQGLNIARADSNSQTSWGILQFNGTSTWKEMEHRFNFYGDPRNPPEAIHMADIMISHGLVARWSCARSIGLSK